MKLIAKLFLLFFLCVLFSDTQAQRILLVDKPGKFKNFKYFVGSEIRLRTNPDGIKHRGTIHVITDTSIIINYDDEIMIADIERIMRTRKGLPFLSKTSRILGAGYLLLDMVNNGINSEPTIVDETTVIISASLVAFSYALVPLHYRQMKRGNPWRIQVLNMSLEGEVPNPFLR
jgi:hypothetical protein